MKKQRQERVSLRRFSGRGALTCLAATVLAGMAFTLLINDFQKTREIYRQHPVSPRLSMVNVHGPTDDLTFRVIFPSRYVVTPGEFWVSYQTQGGQNPPAILLITGPQPLAYDPRQRDDEDTGSNGDRWPRYQQVLSSGHDCIVVWDTDQQSIVAARELTRGDPYTVDDTSTEQLGNYRVTRRVIRDAGGKLLREDAYLTIPDSTVSYYFETCNLNSQTDLQVVLRSFAVRGRAL